jgi:GGDEF domain-containing protein
MRSADTAARFGGKEFTILLEDNNGQDGAIGVTERIALELARPILLKVMDVVVTASIRVAMRGPVSSAAQLLHEADLAMYRPKRNGLGDGYAVFEPELDVTPTKRNPRGIRQPLHHRQVSDLQHVLDLCRRLPPCTIIAVVSRPTPRLPQA